MMRIRIFDGAQKNRMGVGQNLSRAVVFNCVEIELVTWNYCYQVSQFIRQNYGASFCL